MNPEIAKIELSHNPAPVPLNPPAGNQPNPGTSPALHTAPTAATPPQIPTIPPASGWGEAAAGPSNPPQPPAASTPRQTRSEILKDVLAGIEKLTALDLKRQKLALECERLLRKLPPPPPSLFCYPPR